MVELRHAAIAVDYRLQHAKDRIRAVAITPGDVVDDLLPGWGKLLHGCFPDVKLVDAALVPTLTPGLPGPDNNVNKIARRYVFCSSARSTSTLPPKQAAQMGLPGKSLRCDTHRLLEIKEAPAEFDPFLAEWSKVSDATGGCLCASFPTGVLGQNGSFQKVRSGYLLQIDRKQPRALYFVIANTEQKDMSFTAARKLLLKEKWKPINVHAHDDYALIGVEHELAKMHLSEFDSCNIDTSSCIMRYKRGDECLTVFTSGEKIKYMKVVDWNNECPAPSPRERPLRQ